MPSRQALFWLLAASLAFFAWRFYGWAGLALALSITVFLLLLQLTRALRVMRVAADMPLGHVPSAVMFQATLRPGLTMLQVVGTTKTLGCKVDAFEDDWLWSDDGGSSVRLHFERGRLARWQLQRPE